MRRYLFITTSSLLVTVLALISGPRTAAAADFPLCGNAEEMAQFAAERALANDAEGDLSLEAAASCGSYIGCTYECPDPMPDVCNLERGCGDGFPACGPAGGMCGPDCVALGCFDP